MTGTPSHGVHSGSGFQSSFSRLDLYSAEKTLCVDNFRGSPIGPGNGRLKLRFSSLGGTEGLAKA